MNLSFECGDKHSEMTHCPAVLVQNVWRLDGGSVGAVSSFSLRHVNVCVFLDRRGFVWVSTKLSGVTLDKAARLLCNNPPLNALAIITHMVLTQFKTALDM